jgi:uncharacterized membrane protein
VMLSTAESETTVYGMIFVFIGFMLLFSAMGMYVRRTKAYKNARAAYITLILYGLAYVALTGYADTALGLFISSGAICLILSCLKSVTEWYSLNIL